MSLWQRWTRSLQRWLPGHAGVPIIPDALWASTLQHLDFLQQQLTQDELQRLRVLCAHFLQRKQFSGANGLVITDAMALTIAAQACVLILNWGKPAQALRWYDDFVGIVVHPGAVRAYRRIRDDAGVMHHYAEELLGEAMHGGPVMLSWHAVQGHGVVHHPHHPTSGSNVVIHEFAHKLDMANGGADGCPPLPAGFMGLQTMTQARQIWSGRWLAAYEDFCEALSAHERFGQPAPWLDSYAATNPAEFFAVACEAYWLSPALFAQTLPTLSPLLDALFQRPWTQLRRGTA